MDYITKVTEEHRVNSEAEAARIEREKESWLADLEEQKSAKATSVLKTTDEEPEIDITKKYRLVNVVGAGAQLQATVEDLNTGQSKRISVGKSLDGLTVKSISLYDGVVFVDKNGDTQNLNVSNGK